MPLVTLEQREPAEATIAMVCSSCQVLSPTDARLPRGWKRSGNDIFCKKCWRGGNVLRAVSVPIAQPLDCSWEDLRKVLREMWIQTTQASNWIVTELYARDVRRGNQVRMPPMPKAYLYPALRERFPLLPCQTVASLEQATQAKYRAVRYKIIWTAEAVLPTFRFPVPFPMPNQSWHVAIEDGKPIASFRIGDQRLRLRLKSGPQFRRQFQAIGAIAAGRAVKGEAAIYERGTALMAKLVAWLPREKATGVATQGVLGIRTEANVLLIATNTKDEMLWRYNGDHLRRWAAEHRAQLQRWADDSKYENRPKPKFAARREAASGKYRNRMDSACHEIAAQVAGYALRRKFAAVRYDDSIKGYCEQFPWFKLRRLIAEKLDQAGVVFEHASGSPPTEKPEPLSEE